jgi:hypothetical protein
MGDLATADLILIEGCINEVGAESIVYPWTKTSDLRRTTEDACGSPMTAELRTVRQQFPSSVVVVVGYYPLVSGRSSLFGVSGTRRLASRATKIYRGQHPTDQHRLGQKRPRREEHDILVVNSEEFYQDSKTALTGAVETMRSGGDERIFFAKLPEVSIGTREQTVDPLYAYGAPRRHEWMIPIRFLFFWVFYADQKYWYRQRLCAHHVAPGWQRIVCDSSPAFHPNEQGAETYAESIEAAIPAGEIVKWKER